MINKKLLLIRMPPIICQVLKYFQAQFLSHIIIAVINSEYGQGSLEMAEHTQLATSQTMIRFTSCN